MRPRERDDDSATPPPAPQQQRRSPPLPVARTALNSMVVKPPDSVAGRNAAAGDSGGSLSPLSRSDDSRPLSTPPASRRAEPPPSQDERRRLSPLDPRRHGSPLDVRHRGSSPIFRRRRPSLSPGRRPSPNGPARRHGSPSGFQPHFRRFPMDRGNMVHAGSKSPPLYSTGLRYVPGYRGGRSSGRFQDGSSHYGRGRSYGRGYHPPSKDYILIDGQYVHRNDPNLSPREGDWICQNPDCGNLNFARRSHCNNCGKNRFTSEQFGPSHSPRRVYIRSPPHGSPGRIMGPMMSRAPQRDVPRYRSPPPGDWDLDDLREYAARPARGRGRGRRGRFSGDYVRRERGRYHEELDYASRGKYRAETGGYSFRDRPRDEFYPEKRPRRSASPRMPWTHDIQDRSRSPVADRHVKDFYIPRGRGRGGGRGREDRHYMNSYEGPGRTRDMDVSRGRGGRGYRRGGDHPQSAHGRGDQHDMRRSRDDF